MKAKLVNESIDNSLLENKKIDKLLDNEIDSVRIDDEYAHAELGYELLDSGDISIYISEIWSDIRGKGYAYKLLNKIKKIAIQKGVPISLRAAVSNNIQTAKQNSPESQEHLVNWYIRNGFEIREEENRFETDPTAPFMLFNY